MKLKGKDLKAGSLYVVSTPIGNLEDITLRALKVLKEVDLIAAESVNHTRVLLRHYGIKTKLISYNQHNRKHRGPELILRMESGDNIALVTSAGTPAISDPGSFFVKMALERNIKVSPIPGPSAATAAISVCGLPVDRFLFIGFLSNRPGKRRNELRELITEARTMVFFEAPHRIRSMLKDLYEVLGDRRTVVLRELTKIYEETIYGSILHILDKIEEVNTKGEFTIVIAGKEEEGASKTIGTGVRKKIDRLLKERKKSIKDIAEQVSREYGLNYRSIYKECLSRKNMIRE